MSFDAIPIWGIFLATSFVIWVALESGFRLGRRRLAKGASKSEMSGAMVGASMGLLAFMMAFTFNAAAGRHEVRRVLVIDDANAIERAWLRADFLPESQRDAMRKLLREYTDLRLQTADGSIEVGAALMRFDALHDRMWAIAGEAGRQAPGSIMGGLFVEALNEMIDGYVKRLTISVRTRVAPSIWVALYALAALGMLMIGIQNGLGGTRQAGIELALGLSFAIVLFVIADLDRPQEGVINVSQQPIIDLQKRLRSHQ